MSADFSVTIDDTDFTTLVTQARALIPALAPTWTDFNLSDPGITLLELMAFIADAQIYSLGRLRQDERRGYAELMGVLPQGPVPARGVLWPEASVAAGAHGLWLPPTTLAVAPGDAPNCTLDVALDAGIWYTPARLIRLATRAHDGSEHDLTAVNGRPGATFAPFGAAPAPGSELSLRFQGPLVQGCDLSAGEQPVIAIGVEVEPFPDASAVAPTGSRPSAVLSVAVAVSSGFDQPVLIVSDNSAAFAQNGVLLLRLPDALTHPGAPGTVEIVIRLASGAFSPPPRAVRIAANAMPIRQVETVWLEQRATGLPDQTVTITRGVPAQGELLTVRILSSRPPQQWQQVEDLSQAGPANQVYSVDPDEVTYRFGNGVNGAVPPGDATIRIDYAISAGQAGNLAAQSGWSVGGAPIRFVNTDPLAGGTDAYTLDTLRHVARERLANDHPLVTDADIVAAARAAPLLHAGRAQVLDGYDPVTPCLAVALGTRTLIALRERRQSEATAPPSAEDPGWLAALERFLRPRLPLGERLRVTGPGYVVISVKATLATRQGVDANAVVTAATALLQARLAPLPVADYDPWPLGRGVAVLTLAGWLRRLPGVAAVKTLTVNGKSSGEVALRQHELPSLTLNTGDITAAPIGGGA
jgi:hypothetical protein